MDGIFHWMSPFNVCHLLMKVVSTWRLSLSGGRLLMKASSNGGILLISVLSGCGLASRGDLFLAVCPFLLGDKPITL